MDQSDSYMAVTKTLDSFDIPLKRRLRYQAINLTLPSRHLLREELLEPGNQPTRQVF